MRNNQKIVHFVLGKGVIIGKINECVQSFGS